MQPTPPLEHEGVPMPLNVTTPYRGWYPRWWLLSAFCCSIIVALGAVLWRPVMCRDETALLCGIVDRASFIMIIPIWLLFLGLWYGIFAFSIGPVEFTQRGSSNFGSFVRTASQFRSRRVFIVLQGLLAFVLVNVLWWLNRTTPLAFAMLTIVAFVGHCCFFHQLEVNQRRLSFILYAATSLILLMLEVTLRPNFFNHWPPGDEWPLLLTELLLVIVGIIAIINVLRSGLATAQTATDAHNQNINNSISWWVTVRSVWPLSRLVPVRPVTAANRQQQNQPNPQTRQNNRR